MTWVKVCGLTRAEDVRVASGNGADAVGFVVHPASKRYVTPEAVAGMVADAGDAMTVLVAVHLEPGELLAAAAKAGVGGVQPHGRFAAASSQAAIDAGLVVLRPVPVGEVVDLDGVPADQIPLLDTADGRLHGGTGRAFDWALAAGVGRPFVLAGGLNPDNVADAIAAAHPWGVDASSGLELKPGIKHSDKVRRFIEEAKRA